MQEPGRRPAPLFAGVDLRRPKGYPAAPGPAADERPSQEAAPAGDPCPRCQSRDTKFCYYNNYNTSQPRHFCRSCRRYWTKGGSLRNIPVGGGTRKSSSAVAKNSKRRRVAPAAEPAPSTDADSTGDLVNDIAPTTPAPSTEAAATVAEEEPTVAPVAAEELAAPTVADRGCTDTSVALELGPTDDVGDSGGRELPDPAAQFEWPSGCDLGGSYWGAAGVFSDADSQLFLNLP